MTTAIHLTDVHIDQYKAFSFNRDRLEDCLLVIDDTYKLAVKREAKIVLLAGDLFNTPKFLFTKVVNSTMERFSRHIEANPDIVWYAITGNHDFGSKNLINKPAVSALEHLATAFPDNFKILDNESVIFRRDKTVSIVCGIPNYEFKEHFREKLEMLSIKIASQRLALEKAGREVKVTLMIHQSPEGQYNTNVRTQTSPEDALYDPFDMVLCGDIHTSQRINDKFLISGNPLHKDLSDEGKEKGLWIIDLEDPQAIQFKSRKGRYPEFKRVKSGEPVADDGENFIVQSAEVSKVLTDESAANLEEFGSALPKETLLTNFWKSTGNSDKKLLEVGLSFLT